MSRRLFLSLFVLGSFAWAKPQEDVRNELPPPFNLQAVVLQKTITLTWQWPRPEVLPIFKEFGYEIKRQDGKSFMAPGTTYADDQLAPGSYSYQVRVRGTAKQKGKRVIYVSDWSEPASGLIQSVCSRPPTVELKVEPTQKVFSNIPSLRFHITGEASNEKGCTLGSVRYRLDRGTGLPQEGPLPVDGQGHFDTFVNAYGPEDEVPSGRVSFSITATAENEAGPASSGTFTIDADLRNPFAPH